MKKMQYLAGTGLDGRYTGVTEFPNFQEQINKYGLEYDPEKHTRTKKFISFIPEASTKDYQGQTKKYEKEGIEKPEFEIFKDIIGSAKGKYPPLLDTIAEADID